MKFPNLKNNQFSVLMSNCEAGIVLNTDLTVYRQDEKKMVYSVFENLEQAKGYINKISSINNKIEFVIYNSNQELIEFITAKNY